jgi:putative oxidoreductase
MQGLENVGAFAGRLFLAVIFILAGFNKFGNLAGTAGYMAANGFPEALTMPGALLAALIEFGGGVLLVLGYKARLAALIIFLFMIPTTLIFHTSPWAEQQINFMKNLAIMGGLLIIATQGGGGWSLERRREAMA